MKLSISWNQGIDYQVILNLFLVVDAKAVTRNDRYLVIATSGGLNQQRTGVSFMTSLVNTFLHGL